MSQEPELQPRVAPRTDDASGASADHTAAASEAPATRSARKARAQAAKAELEPVEAEVRPAAQVYNVAVPAFEGPLDLLLHLIQQHELDIRDIPIAFISQKYVEYITLMQELNIDLASEYLVMAATLAHIKSKLLLPTPPAGQEEEAEEELDPRAELIRRLLEYQKYKQAAAQLGENPVLGRDVFTRGAPAPTVDGPAPLAQVSVFKLLDAFQGILKRVKQSAEHLIGVDRISISERIVQLTDLLRGRSRVRFEELFDENVTRADRIVTFLALLEMTRLRMTRVIQDGPLEPISVELAVDESADARMLDGFQVEKADESFAPPSPADYEEEADSDAEALDGDPLAAELAAADSEIEDVFEESAEFGEDESDEATAFEGSDLGEGVSDDATMAELAEEPSETADDAEDSVDSTQALADSTETEASVDSSDSEDDTQPPQTAHD
jgi:segregation and condensation protein A